MSKKNKNGLRILDNVGMRSKPGAFKACPNCKGTGMMHTTSDGLFAPVRRYKVRCIPCDGSGKIPRMEG